MLLQRLKRIAAGVAAGCAAAFGRLPDGCGVAVGYQPTGTDPDSASAPTTADTIDSADAEKRCSTCGQFDADRTGCRRYEAYGDYHLAPNAVCGDWVPAGTPVRAVVPGRRYRVDCTATDAEAIGLYLTHRDERLARSVGAAAAVFDAAMAAEGLTETQRTRLHLRRMQARKRNSAYQRQRNF